MSLRLVSSARNLREQFKSPTSPTANNGNNQIQSSGASVHTNSSGISRAQTLEPSSTSLSRQGSLLRSTSNGNLRRAKSMQKKPTTLMSKVFADESNQGHTNELQDLSMEMTLLVVKRCVKEIRERGLTTKGILRQVQMGLSHSVTMDTIRQILDDDASTELSALHQIDIHLVAHAMKSAIRYSEETLVTYEDYQALYLNQDRNFSFFVRDLPAINRSILLDLFSLCADVTLLAHLNNMTLVSVAKAISLCIMAEPEREFTTFDASLQQRNLWGAACEDLLRAFLRIKTSQDLAMIEREDDVDENRYIDNTTRVLKSARQQTSEYINNSTVNSNQGHPDYINMPASHPRVDVSLPSSAGSSMPGSANGWPSHTQSGPASAGTPRSYANDRGYFDQAIPPRPTSPLSQSGNMHNATSLSRSQSFAQSSASLSRPMSPAPQAPGEEATEYEELMEDQSHLSRLRQSMAFLRPGVDLQRRRSSVADMESLYRESIHSVNAVDMEDGYESDPEVTHGAVIPDFEDGLNWDFTKQVDPHNRQTPSLAHFQVSPPRQRDYQRGTDGGDGYDQQGVYDGESPTRSIRDLSKQELLSMRLRYMNEQRCMDTSSSMQHGQRPPSLYRAQSQQDLWSREPAHFHSAPIQLPSAAATAGGSTRVRPGHAMHPLARSPAIGPHRSKRNSALRRSISMDPHSMHGRLRDSVSSQLTFQTDRSLEENRRHLMVMNPDHQDSARASSEFSLQQSPLDLERVEEDGRTQQDFILQNLLKGMGGPQSSLVSTSMTEEPMAIEPQQQQQPPRTFQVLSRPKDIEVSVLFTPIAAVNPNRAELKSKFQESFPERPISPPPGYGSKNPKRSLTGGSNRGAKQPSPSSSNSTVASPRQKQAPHRSNTSPPTASSAAPSRVVLQQGATFSGISTSSSPTIATEGKKTSGFIRALSKLRSKTSEDQLKSGKNSTVGAAPPTVSIEPPRLELNFLGSLGSSSGGFGPNQDLMTAPALMLHSESGSPVSLQNWRREAQASLPIPDDTTSVPSSPASQRDLDQSMVPKGFTGARRASATVFGSSQQVVKDQRRRFKKAMSPPSSPQRGAAITNRKKSNAANDNGTGVSPPRVVPSIYEDSTLTMEFDLNAPTGTSAWFSSTPSTPSSPSSSSSNNIPKKSAAVQNEFRFSTATLLKDGKLYYQLQWDQFSELGFKSDFFTEPEQYMSGINQSRSMSQTDPIINSASQVASRVGDEERAPVPLTMKRQGETSSSTTTDPLGQNSNKLGQGQGRGQAQGQAGSLGRGPTPEQRAAAMRAAQASFMALAKDPKALAQLKAESSKGGATIISHGSFRGGSNQPTIMSALPSLSSVTMSSTSILNSKRHLDSSSNSNRSSAETTPRTSLHSTSMSVTSPAMSATPSVEGLASLQRNMSARSLPKSFTTIGHQQQQQHQSRPSMGSSTRSMDPRLGSVSVGGSGSSFSVSSQQQLLQRGPHGKLSVSAVTDSTAGGATTTMTGTSSSMTTTTITTMGKAKKKGFFGGGGGKKSKKHDVGRQSGSTTSSASSLPSSANGGRQRRLLPVGVRRQDVMTKTEESLDEVFPWMCIEHMAGQESGWVMLEPVQDGAVGWVVIDKLEEEMEHMSQPHNQQQQHTMEQHLQQHQQQQARQDQQDQWEKDQDQVVPCSSATGHESNSPAGQGLLDLKLGQPLFEAESTMLLA
ncbi:hypothetical protein BGZ83_006676 [Gryganskiella cystojenkinii]|nr:hypothetical protein BGZ83_006676 [Gryganskiella cystojenkinii]